MKLKKNFFLNFSSIPNLTRKARKKKSFTNVELNKIIKLSSSKGFIGVEFPFFRFLSNNKSAKYLNEYLIQHNQKYILDCEKKISKKELLKLITVAKKLNLNFIRLKCSNILSCERSKYGKDWIMKIKAIIKKINQIKTQLHKNEIKLAIENHQDLDSNDILYIIKKVGKKYVGVNFDIGNSFATCETPIGFFKKVKNFIINIHLKDYIILPTDKGYALHRCPILEGDSQIKEILFLIKKYNIKAPISLELGAISKREIKINSKKFFDKFIKEKNIKIKNLKFIMNIAKKNFINKRKIKKVISLNEINMLNKSIKNLN